MLDAAHIRPHADDGPDHVSNGLLIRTDLHRLFEDGYVTVTAVPGMTNGRMNLCGRSQAGSRTDG